MKGFVGSRGFTLVELMIAVAVIGVLAALAIPAYNQYIIRVRVIELIHLASSAKSEMAEYIITHDSFPSDATEAGITLINTDYLSSMAVNNSGLISLTSDASIVGANVTINLQAINNISSVDWTCTSSGETQFAPSNCR